jgi:hypothetical protein
VRSSAGSIADACRAGRLGERDAIQILPPNRPVRAARGPRIVPTAADLVFVASALPAVHEGNDECQAKCLITLGGVGRDALALRLVAPRVPPEPAPLPSASRLAARRAGTGA